MRRVVRWGAWLIGVFVLLRAGISIFRAPTYEVLYALVAPTRTCVPQICTTMLRLEIGNTGTRPQENVRIRLRAAPLAKLLLPLTVRNFGVVDRPVRIEESGGQRFYDLGLLEPKKRVELQVVFYGQRSEHVPTWDEIFVAVEPSMGDARPGDPSVVMFARLLNAFFGWL